MDYLREQADIFTESTLTLVSTGEAAMAAHNSGAAVAFKQLAQLIVSKRIPREDVTTDSTWVDPASRRSKREVTT